MALRRVLDDAELAGRLVEAGTARAAGFSMERLAARYVDLYAALLDRPAGPQNATQPRRRLGEDAAGLSQAHPSTGTPVRGPGGGHLGSVGAAVGEVKRSVSRWTGVVPGRRPTSGTPPGARLSGS